MLHACVQRFDVTENLENFCKILGTKQAQGVEGPKDWTALVEVLFIYRELSQGDGIQL